MKSTQHEEVDAMNAVKATEHNLEVQLAELEERLRVSELKLTEQVSIYLVSKPDYCRKRRWTEF